MLPTKELVKCATSIQSFVGNAKLMETIFGWILIRSQNALGRQKFRELLSLLMVVTSTACAQDADALQARYSELKSRLANSPFHHPLILESAQTADKLNGDVFSVVEQPFAVVREALQSVDHWCDILILHLNVKRCKAIRSSGANRLSLAIGTKNDQAVADAYALEFAYSIPATSPGYLQVRLNADEGPLRTKNYSLQLQAVAIDARHSFIHMSYAFAFGLPARIAMKAYLATLGREKVGFSIVNHQPDGRPVFIRGALGLVERNTMRYYLAIDAYLDAYILPPADQTERRLIGWFASTEQYATQLHELARDEYLTMKRKEIWRQETE